MRDVSREEIVGGAILRVLVVLAAPLVAQNFALVAQSVVDLFWVGRLGGTAVAAWLLAYFYYSTERGMLDRATDAASAAD